MDMILIVLGGILSFLGGMGLSVVACRRMGAGWRLGRFILSWPTFLIIAIKDWEEAKKPFFLLLVGVGILFLGRFLRGF